MPITTSYSTKNEFEKLGFSNLNDFCLHLKQKLNLSDNMLKTYLNYHKTSKAITTVMVDELTELSFLINSDKKENELKDIYLKYAEINENAIPNNLKHFFND